MNKVILYNYKANILSKSCLLYRNVMRKDFKFYCVWLIRPPRFSTYDMLLNKKLCITSFEIQRNVHEDGMFQRLKNNLKYHLFIKNQILVRTGQLYVKIEKSIDYKKFFEVCQLPDTFYSWYLVMELHIWMMSTRVMVHSEHGRAYRNGLIKSMWLDIQGRAKELKGSNVPARKKQEKDLVDHYGLSFISYDEALNGNDKVLAAALWRTIFLHEGEEPQRIECLINYVRKNLAHLDAIAFEDLLSREAKISFLPLLDPSQLNI